MHSASALKAQLDQTWTVSANGQTVPVRADGTFRLPNISAPDAFGVGGPGTAPDFVSDDFIRVTGISTAGGRTRYMFSEAFQLRRGEVYRLRNIVITDTAPPDLVSLRVTSPTATLNGVRQTAQLVTTARLADGREQDVTPQTSWTSYRASNPAVASVDANGLVTALGAGRVMITATNQGTTAITTILVSVDDPLTAVEGRVVDGSGAPVNGASITLQGQVRGTSDAAGRFRVPDMPTLLGDILVFASAPAVGAGSSTPARPVPQGITDVGDIRLLPVSIGRDYMVVFQTNLDTPTLRLFLAGDLPAAGRIEAPGISLSTAFTVTPGQVTAVTIPNSSLVGTSDGIVNRGIRIQSDNPVSVYGINRATFSSDGFTALPVSTLGVEYRIASYTPLSGYPAQIAVAGVEDSTVVTVIPSRTVGSRTAGVAYSVTIRRHEVYSLRGGVDLTGTLVRADRPVAVFSGNQCTNVPIQSAACDHLVEQMPPVSYWGVTYASIPFASRRNGDTFRILAHENNTQVQINGPRSEAISLQAGQFAERLLDGGNQITSNFPILVLQYSNSQNFDGRTGDPFMTVVAPAERFRRTFELTTPSGFTSHFVNIVVSTADLAAVRLDGVPVTPIASFRIGDTGYTGIQVSLTEGCHALTSPSPVGAYVYGFGNYDSYGYAAGL